MLTKFGKKSGDIFQFIQSYFDKNKEFLNICARHAAVYLAQPKRERCKICDVKLEAETSFELNKIPYIFCARCGHLNGKFEDTNEFSKAIHDNVDYYDDFYKSTDPVVFKKRAETIYQPKALFLKESLEKDGVQPQKLNYTDFGAGSGYFVSALLESGMENCQGLELSESQVAHGNRHIPGNRLRKITPETTSQEIAGLKSEVISMVGVLEHVQKPREVLAAIKENRNIRYLFITVPMFSFCVFLEMAFDKTFPRHLSGDHTHLFTNSSLKWIGKEFGMSVVGEWWFGADMMDLYRHMAMTLKNQNQSKKISEKWDEIMLPLVDSMQLQLDEKRQSSEVHMVFKINR